MAGDTAIWRAQPSYGRWSREPGDSDPALLFLVYRELRSQQSRTLSRSHVFWTAILKSNWQRSRPVCVRSSAAWKPCVPPRGARARRAVAPPAVSRPLPTADPSPRVAAGTRSLESRIGSQFLNRIGIFAMLMGLALHGFEAGLRPELDRPRGTHLDWPIQCRGFASGMVGAFSQAWLRDLLLHLERPSVQGSGVYRFGQPQSVYRLLPFAASFLAMSVLTAVKMRCSPWRQDSELAAPPMPSLAAWLRPPCSPWESSRRRFSFSYLLMLDAGALLLLVARPLWKRLRPAPSLERSFITPYGQHRLLRTTGIYDDHDLCRGFLRRLREALPCHFCSFTKLERGCALVHESLFLVVFPMANAAVVFTEMMFLLDGPRDHDLRAAAAVFFGRRVFAFGDSRVAALYRVRSRMSTSGWRSSF